MKKFGNKLLQIFIYSSLNISIAAALFVLEANYIFRQSVNFKFPLLVFCATMLTYSIHRIIGIKKLSLRFTEGRFVIIQNLKKGIISIALISFLILLYISCIIPLIYLKLLLIPGIISMFYILPLFNNGKRLRDFPYIKILLIGIVWASIAMIPIYSNQELKNNDLIVVLLFLEKLIYITLITIPFDVRDLEVDTHMHVKTIPYSIGKEKSFKLTQMLLLIDFALWMGIAKCTNLDYLGYMLLIAMILISYLFIKIAWNKSSDLYFSGLLDSTITIRSLLIIMAYSLS